MLWYYHFYSLGIGSERDIVWFNDDRKFDRLFVFKKRTVWFKKGKSGIQGNWIYTFRDNVRQSDFQARFVECAGKEYGEEEFEPIDVLDNPRFGYFFLKQHWRWAGGVYLSYKQWWNIIEECFDYLNNSVIPSASYAYSDEFYRGWCFLFHVCLLYFPACWISSEWPILMTNTLRKMFWNWRNFFT